MKITTAQHVEIGYGFSADFDRIRALKQTKLDPVPADSDETQSAFGADAHRSAVSVVRPASNLGWSSSLDSGLSSPSGDNKIPPPGSSEDGEPQVARADSPAADTETPLGMIVRLNVFSMAYDDATEIIPLVDLWFELANHLTADNIPSPLEFYKEQHAVIESI